MIRHAIIVGIIGGIVLSLTAVYPIAGLLAPLWLEGWVRPFPDDLTHGILLMASAALAVPTFLLIGFVAARPSRGWREGAKAGMVAGLAAAGLCYFTIILPVNTLIAFGTIGASLDVLVDSFMPPLYVLRNYVIAFENAAFQGEMVLVVAACFWGAQGALVGWRRRNQPRPPRPSLFALVQNGEHPRRYFAGDETAVWTGILVGLVVAVLTAVTLSGWSYLVYSDWPELMSALQESHSGIIASGSLGGLAGLLSPLLGIVFIAFGAVVVGLLKNPPNWFRARFWAVVVAGTAISLALHAVALRLLYFNLGLAPFWVLHERTHTLDPQAMAEMARAMELIEMGFRDPAFVLSAVLFIPWVVLLSALLVGVIVGGVQAAIYVPILSMVRKRPVDQALMARRYLKNSPNDVLPGVYNLFIKDDQAYEVLAHLTACIWKRPSDISRFTAAYHTLGTSKKEEEYVATIADLNQTLAANRQWRWALDFAGVYATLHQVMSARSLEQILKIEPPPEQHTSSLPPLVVKSQQRIGRIVLELKKVERTDDLPTKLIFLENALAAIHEAQTFVDKEFADPDCWATPLPQTSALQAALKHWEEMVLTAVKRLKGRADILSSLRLNHTTFLPELPLPVTVRNQGLNVAQQVRVRLLPGDAYDLLGVKSEGFIEILAPSEERTLNLLIMPREGAPRVRVAWEVVFDDAVDDQRHVTFGDKLEFVESERPFTRVFPIPYVTGTPLKTDDVFVGRDDVFGFVEEMLVGAHQNNMVILHGQRRTGKTSVLYRLPQLLADTHYAVLIDMQGKPARGEAEFLYAIADDIVFTLEDQGIVAELPPRAEFAENPEFFFRSRFLRSLTPHLNGKNLLLMFDEFEELQRRVEDGRLQPEIFHFLRNLMQHDEHVDFIFAGTHKLEELGAEYWSALFNIAAYRPITFLRPTEMRRLILEPIKQYSTEYDPLAVERIISVTAGHPYFAQLLLHEMMVYHNEMKASYLTAVDVDQVIERIIGRGEAHFRYIWDESTAEEQQVLQGMAELLVCAEGATAKDLRALLTDRGLQSPDRWKAALTSLENRDILSRNDAKSPLYRFHVDLIRLWVERTRPSL
ncbi:MAG TPA: hypothetical protein PLD25_05460 [Chloroflexota bacterium]|nr:hypothetical protein [Chloroflexota bacterium]